MMNKAVVYARLSREDEDKLDGNKKESRSIENQIKFLTSYAEKNSLTITNVYCDDGVSGGTFDRPAFNEMITDKIITPMISSKIAAETITVPILEFNLPNSFKVATVTETEVAVKMTP